MHAIALFISYCPAHSARTIALITTLSILAASSLYADDRFEEWTPEDVIAGFDGNRKSFEGLTLCWSTSREFKEAWFTMIERAIHQTEQELTNSSDGSIRNQLISRISSYKSMLESPKNRGVRTIYLGFSTDWNGFVLCLPKQDTGPLSISKIASPVPGNLLTTHSDIQVLAYSPGNDDLFRMWHGVDSYGGQTATILVNYPPVANISLPPFGYITPHNGGPAHEIDQFFLHNRDSYKIITNGPLLEGLSPDIIVMEYSEEKPVEAFLTAGQREEYGTRLQLFSGQTAYIDTTKGFLPIRIERFSRNIVDGIPVVVENSHDGELSRESMHDIEIKEVSEGKFYPISGTITYRINDPGIEGHVPTSIEELIRTKTIKTVAQVPSEVAKWSVSEVKERALENYAMEFPDSTAVYDKTKAESRVIGEIEDVVDDFADKSKGNSSKATLLNNPTLWVVAANLLAVLAIGFYYVSQVRKKKRNAK
ncbi:hypothetical protein Pla110_24550 [Polystyrenella longa]|uniref:Uncharacterized protein n=1 Tax=Polystyrenella longa TaxID=2528007 RepID=A0A518CNB5_9PLAN|nr:hypothetical protein [Polystyrenella longa]QDU80722.1 hypothetical protein Pla110_24550 [Polystyrenella longa]